ncbi:MAG: hypothetical protein ACREH5_07995 [Candidatus Omnitrophota bacterium]
MTTESLILAIKNKMDRFGLPIEIDAQLAVEEAIGEFLSLNIWGFMEVPDAAVSTVSGKSYLKVPNNFFKITLLRRSGYEVTWINPSEYNRRRAVNYVSGVAGTRYTQIGDRVIVDPPVTGVTAYTMSYYPKGANMTLENIPDPFHFLIKKLAIKELVPLKHEAYGAVVEEADLALKKALEIDSYEPFRHEKMSLEPVQQARNYFKYVRKSRRAKTLLETLPHT